MTEKKEEAKPGKGQGGIGLEKDDAQGAEVAGRRKRILYVCFNDGTGNYVDPAWLWFSCWRCGATIYLDGSDDPSAVNG